VYFKHFSVKVNDPNDTTFSDIVVSLVDTDKTLLIIKNLLRFGTIYSIEYESIKPILFKWGRNKNV
jgi:hypothetical protein